MPKLRNNSTVASQLRTLGQLAAALDNDMSHPVEVFEKFFDFTSREKEIFLRGYNDRDDPLNATVR